MTSRTIAFVLLITLVFVLLFLLVFNRQGVDNQAGFISPTPDVIVPTTETAPIDEPTPTVEVSPEASPTDVDATTEPAQ